MARITIIIEDDYSNDRVSVYAEVEKPPTEDGTTTQAEHFAQEFFGMIAEGADEIHEDNGSVTYRQQGGPNGKH